MAARRPPAGTRRRPRRRRSAGLPVPAQPADQVRGDQILGGHRTRSDNAPRPARAASSRAAASGLRRLHRTAGGGPFCGSEARGGSRSSRAAASASSQTCALRRCLGPPKTGSVMQLLDGFRVGGRGVDDRRVGQDPARRDVAAAGDVVARRPQLAHRGQRAAVAHLVDARRAAPTVAAGRRGDRRCAGARIPVPPNRSCPVRRVRPRPRRAVRAAPRRRARRSSARPPAAGAWTSRRRRGPWPDPDRADAAPSRPG